MTFDWFLHRPDARVADTAPIRGARLFMSPFGGNVAADLIGARIEARAPQPAFFGEPFWVVTHDAVIS